MGSCIKQYFLVACLVGMSFSVSAASVHADEKYYMILFTYEGTPDLPRLAHTFATFVKADNKKILETQTISWMPATLNVRILLAAPERGVNLDLPQSLKLAKSHGARIIAWGPYEIQKDLYVRASAQVNLLQSGKIAYKALDGKVRGNGGTNCFHAISDIAEGPLLNTGTAFGQPATIMVRDHLARYIIESKSDLRWIIDALGLSKEPIIAGK